ncbi:MAG: pseudouridine-5'-phosphate glycosidase [Proteobacteria bacterium]|nr:pseudouridine-5'-phosphate glycosidase [Pseudomonadota bacterium]
MKIEFSPDVAEARKSGQAIVALESTIISHGFPHPENLAVAAEMEETVRQQGAVPATIALIDGNIKCGLTESEVHRLATDAGVRKCSVRDMAVIMAEQAIGSTTVAATAFIAAKAGIKVFATGGIGGVHRREEGADGYDISSDLLELSRTNIIVVSAGAKSLLDLPATLEVLETYSVAVVGYETNEFPAFHTRSSGLKLPHRADSLDQLTAIGRSHFELDGEAGMLVCNPVPEEAAMKVDEIESLITQARAEAISEGIKGAAVTPYILAALNRLSDGRTSEVNKALALNNADLAARLAVRLA